MPHPRSGSTFSLALGLLCAGMAAPLALVACSHDWDLYDPRGGVAASGSGGAEPDAGTGSVGPGGGTGTGGAGTGGAGTGGTGGGVSVDGGPGPVTEGLVALYTFEEGQGTTVHDVSNVAPALDLTIMDPAAVMWGQGKLVVAAPTLITSEVAATKVIDRCKMTNELTVEAWFQPANTTQEGPARIVTNSFGTSNRNFQLGQEITVHRTRLRTTLTDGNGLPSVDGALDVKVEVVLTHLVLTRDASGVRRLYVNAAETGTDPKPGGDFSTWEPSYKLMMANESDMSRSWLGELHRIAIYDRALSAAEVAQNHEAGP